MKRVFWSRFLSFKDLAVHYILSWKGKVVILEMERASLREHRFFTASPSFLSVLEKDPKKPNALAGDRGEGVLLENLGGGLRRAS